MKIPYKYAVALTAALALFMVVLDSTIVNVALVAIERNFQTTINSVQWIITGYLLAQAAVIPVTGYFGNRFGTKRLFILALGSFTIFSFLCGLSPHLATGDAGLLLLIVFRVLQGIGGGMLFPLGSAIAFGAFPPEERAASSAVVGIPILLAPALGPTVGGLIVDSALKWPWIFFINVPVGIITVALIARIIQRDEKATAPGGAQPRFDYAGLLLSIIGVVLVVYAFVVVSQTKSGSITPQTPNGTINGWGYWLVWALLGAGILILAIFSVLELRVVKDPVLDLRLFLNRDFTIATVATWLARALVFGSFLLVPLFLQQFRGQSAVHTGLILMAQGIGALIGIVSGSRLYDRVGPRILTTFGMLVLVGGTIWLIRIAPDSDARFFVPPLFIRGIAFGWSNLPLQTVALGSITGRALPKASSLYNASAQIFTSIGTAVTTTLLVQRTTVHATEIVASTTAAGARPPANLLLLAGTEAMSDVFRILSFGTVLVCLVCFFLPRQSIKQQMAGASAPPTPTAAPAEPERPAAMPIPAGGMRPAFATGTPAPAASTMPIPAPAPRMPERAMPSQPVSHAGRPPGMPFTQQPIAGAPMEARSPSVVPPVSAVAPAPVARPIETERDTHDQLVAALEQFVRSEAGATQQGFEQRIAALEQAVARLTAAVQQQRATVSSVSEERFAALERTVESLDQFARSRPSTRWYQMHDLRSAALEQRIAGLERAVQQLTWGEAPTAPLDGNHGAAPNGTLGYRYGDDYGV